MQVVRIPKKGKGMVRELFFHVIDGDTDEFFADSWTKRTTKEKSGWRHAE